ncbi:MAG TPA: PDZ domain-containing protein [Pirellulales bacterium]
MNIAGKYQWTIVSATAVAVAMYFTLPCSSFARGGGGGHGGGHGGEHHEASHHEGEHHPYHPTEHHFANHDEHHDDHHWNHHHHDWHYAGWGWNPGFWGGLGLGYVGGSYVGGWGGGDTYVNNYGTDNTPDNSTTDNTANSAASVADDNSPGNDNSAQAANAPEKFPVDVWPELGVSTYSGEYGQSKGLVVVRVMPHSAADRAGLVPGDVILQFNGQPTPDDTALETILDAAHGDFKLWVWDARTGRKSVITGALDAENDAEAQKAPG